jgi:Mrp family chromosome partitioning ATPase
MPTVAQPPPSSAGDGWNLEDEPIDGGPTSADLLGRRFGPVDESGLRTAVNAAPTNRMPVVRQRVSTPGAGTPATGGGPDVHSSTTLRDLPAVQPVVQPRSLFGAATSPATSTASPPTTPATAPAGGVADDASARARVRDVPLVEPAGATAAAIPASSSATAAATAGAPTADPKRAAPTRILDRAAALGATMSPAPPPAAAPATATPSATSDTTSVGPPPSAPPARSTGAGARDRDEETATGRTRVEVARHVLAGELDPRLVLLTEPDSPRSASFRVLRHRLAENGNPRLIAVSSPERGDGKTTTAANLALALGERGRARVLLVEANLRTPDLATVFGFLPPTCFARQLAAHREHPMDAWSVVDIADTGLHVAAVHPDTARGALVDGVALGVALAALARAGYDYVVVDTPAVLGAADVNLVADYAHGVLLVSRAGKTTARALRRAVEQVAPAHLLGLMLLDA